MGHNNACNSYRMNGEELQSVPEETYLGIIVPNDLIPSKQCAVKKANMTLEMIKRHKSVGELSHSVSVSCLKICRCIVSKNVSVSCLVSELS